MTTDVAKANANLLAIRDRCRELYGDQYPAYIAKMQGMLAQAREKYQTNDQFALMKLTKAMAAQGTPFDKSIIALFGAAIVENSEEGTL